MTNEEKGALKMSGYLEKKGKLKVMYSWKSHWFVLEGRLLLYYRSKDEYDALSPCKGSINLGPPCNVKPSTLFGGSCVFQIETRSNTVVLKAKTKTELEKWLQAILNALNQNCSNPGGMAHFRYSSENLFAQNESNKKKSSRFTRQNSMPGRLSRYKTGAISDGDDVQSHGKSVEIIRRSESDSPIAGKFCDFRRKKYKSSHDVTFTSGDDGLLMKKSKRQTYPNSRSLTSSRSSLLVDNDQYCAVGAVDFNKKNEDLKMKKVSSEGIYEKVTEEETIVENENYSNSEPHYDRPSYNSIIVENDQYCGKETKLENKIYDKPMYSSVMVENDQYCTPKITVTETDTVNYHEYNLQSSNTENIYSVPLKSENIDHNDNSVSNAINPYSVCQLYAKRLIDEPDGIYAVPNEIEPDLPPRQDNIAKIVAKFMKLSGRGDGESHKLVKKKSFIKRIFRRKRGKNKKKCDENSTNEDEYVMIDETVITKLEKNRDVDKQVLNELKNILTIKKDLLEEIMKSDSNNEESIRGNSDESKANEIQPAIPVKQKNRVDVRIFAFPKLRKTQNDSSREDQPEKLKTIDEILDDLDAVESDQKIGKVKKLIEIFDKSKTSNTIEDDVVLRTKSPANCRKSQNLSQEDPRRYSDELNRLLNELVKVTNAPILSPGATSSLGTMSSTEDGELFSLLSKKRRLSEPDYDIPRPHTNLHITKAEDVDNDRKLTPTRFFGPALNTNQRDQSIPSMTPDSLEQDKFPYNEHTNLPSYTSHEYIKANSDCVRSDTKQNSTIEQTSENNKFDESYPDSLEVATIL